jgi:hypothetical protein
MSMQAHFRSEMSRQPLVVLCRKQIREFYSYQLPVECQTVIQTPQQIFSKGHGSKVIHVIIIYYLRNIIDVAALDTHLLEQSEYNDRVKLYAQRLAHQWNSIQVNDTKYNGDKGKL